jgi:hypothetical protein
MVNLPRRGTTAMFHFNTRQKKQICRNRKNRHVVIDFPNRNLILLPQNTSRDNLKDAILEKQLRHPLGRKILPIFFVPANPLHGCEKAHGEMDGSVRGKDVVSEQHQLILVTHGNHKLTKRRFLFLVAL